MGWKILPLITSYGIIAYPSQGLIFHLTISFHPPIPQFRVQGQSKGRNIAASPSGETAHGGATGDSRGIRFPRCRGWYRDGVDGVGPVPADLLGADGRDQGTLGGYGPLGQFRALILFSTISCTNLSSLPALAS